ncbi:hypothetical protein [Streptomyces alfalfae]
MTTHPENPTEEPSAPHTGPDGHPPTRTPRAQATRQRLHQLRRTATAHAFRGLCYGLGTAAAGLLSYWIQQHYM